MNDTNVVISLKRFVLIEQCPAQWKDLDLYIFRDDSVAFYIGQSHLAFERVWDHLLHGFKGHSIVGRFVWCNWPASMRFTIELLSSKFEQFDSVGNDVNAAERSLIQHWAPCFNVSQNRQATPVPPSYLPANARLRCSRSLNKLIHQAEHAVRAEDHALWIQGIEKMK
jgi:hypothetical protein